MWCPLVQGVSLNRILNLIWVDARREHTDELLNAILVGHPNDVAIDRKVLFEEAHFVIHVGEEAADFRS